MAVWVGSNLWRNPLMMYQEDSKALGQQQERREQGKKADADADAEQELK